MKDYLNFEGLTRFFNKLFEKFSVIGHTHTKAEITDFEEMTAIATDDGEGNVTLVITNNATSYDNRLAALENSGDEVNAMLNTVNEKVNTLENEVETINTFINGNDILTAE